MPLSEKMERGNQLSAKALSSFIQTEGRYLWEEQDIKGDSVAERAERVGYVLQKSLIK